jgi:hypothetical protein
MDPKQPSPVSDTLAHGDPTLTNNIKQRVAMRSFPLYWKGDEKFPFGRLQQSWWVVPNRDTAADEKAREEIREQYIRRSAAKKADADANKGGRHRCKSNKTRRTRKCKCNTRRRMRR